MTAHPYTIYFEETDECVVMDWDGYSTSEQFKEGSELMLSLVEEHKSKVVLADMKDMLLISMEDQYWAVNDFLSRLSDAGAKKIAVVASHYYYGQVALEFLKIKANEARLECKIFHNLETARNWIKSPASA